mgnify:CR=1 FL=1
MSTAPEQFDWEAAIVRQPARYVVERNSAGEKEHEARRR